MSTLKVTTIQNLSGTEVYTAKAWVNFNGTGTVAIRASGNVSSITDNGTGDYTINFTVAMTDANYSIVGMSDYVSTNIQGSATWGGTDPTASACRVGTRAISGALADAVFCDFSVFR